MISDELLSKFNRIQDLPVSEEMLGAYLEGNLSESEAVAISKEVAQDENLRAIVEAIINDDNFGSNIMDINETVLGIDLSTLQLPLNLSSNMGEHQDIDNLWVDSLPSFTKKDALTEDDSICANEGDNLHFKDIINSSCISMKEKLNFGYEPNRENTTFDLNIYQGNQPSCAIRSQEIIMRDYGIFIPQEELIAYAQRNGWYNPDPEIGGTPRDATGNLLDAVGVETRRYDNASIFDIISELRAGHRVIVSVDADELWIKNEPKLYKRIFGELSNRLNDKMDDIAGVQGANHALIVAGVNVNPANPSDMKVVLIDSGSGDVCIEYSFKDFKKAWDDSHCHMVTTTQAAPFQYNYETHQMEPSNFQSDFMPSMVNLPAGLHNQFELPSAYFDEYGNTFPEYSKEHMAPFGENWDCEVHAERENLAKLSTNSSYEEGDLNSSDETTEEEDTSFEKDDEPVGSSFEEDTTTHPYDEDDDTFDSDSDHTENDSYWDFDNDSDL